MFEVVVMAKNRLHGAACIKQLFMSQYDNKVWPLPSGLIYAGAPPFSTAA
jgi:hypothetical protein